MQVVVASVWPFMLLHARRYLKSIKLGLLQTVQGSQVLTKMTLRHLRILVPRRHKSEAAKLPERRKSHEWCKG